MGFEIVQSREKYLCVWRRITKVSISKNSEKK
ncbi:MAG: hypothetical protein Harvfovirus29_10 [Harvfovirus sp.]|uniref:Uncharacterized protein n=1 Tax=Harvfovirus sp. TaxID=2487768 RepID=A0A3G5A553_9VIRU|nr:MAG: hypothetical protein Harvfovirus29_10 [Harvfovirus sp.]